MERGTEPCPRKSYSSTRPCSRRDSTPWCTRRSSGSSTRYPTLQADEIANAARYERNGERKTYRAGHYERSLTAKAGRLESKVPKLKGALFESAVIERYRRRESSVEEALMEMYLAGVSTRRVDDISVLVAIGVDAEGHREVIGVTEGMKEDRDSWEQCFRSMIERGLKGIRLVVGDRCDGLVATVGSMLPKTRYQRCMVHFMRNVLSKAPPAHREWASAALKAVFAMESRESALDRPGRSPRRWSPENSGRRRTACARGSARPPPTSCPNSRTGTAGASARTT